MWTVSEVEESHECYPRGKMNSLVIKGIKKNPADFQGRNYAWFNQLMNWLIYPC